MVRAVKEFSFRQIVDLGAGQTSLLLSCLVEHKELTAVVSTIEKQRVVG